MKLSNFMAGEVRFSTIETNCVKTVVYEPNEKGVSERISIIIMEHVVKGGISTIFTNEEDKLEMIFF